MQFVDFGFAGDWARVLCACSVISNCTATAFFWLDRRSVEAAKNGRTGSRHRRAPFGGVTTLRNVPLLPDEEPNSSSRTATRLGGSRKGALPLEKPASLLRQVALPNLSALTTAQWRSGTLVATMYILFRIHASHPFLCFSDTRFDPT